MGPAAVNLKNDPYNRFDGYDIPPAKNGDYAFLLHFIASLKSTGKGAIILPHGVLYRGNKEADIRRKIINRGYIKGIIGLPANLFYGTGIPACIIVIDKEDAKHRTGIFMIDASKGFKKDGNKNRLRAQDIHKIVSVFNKQTEIEGYSCMVPTNKITDTENIYNLNIRRYIDNSDPEITHDVDAHLNGGIPDTDINAFNPYWGVFPTLRKELFIENGRLGYSELKVETQQVKNTILSHSEFTVYQQRITTIIDKWYDKHKPLLLGIDKNTSPGNVIRTLSEDLLIQFGDLSPLDKYDVYQKLMNYWDDIMQDDVYLIVKHDWESGRTIREAYDKEEPDFTIKKGQKTIKYIGELIPASLVIATFFDDEKRKLDQLEVEIEILTQNKEEFEEEHGDGDGALVGLEGSRGKIIKGNVEQRVKEHFATLYKVFPKGTSEHALLSSVKIKDLSNREWIENLRNQDSLFKKLETSYWDDAEGILEELNVLYDYIQLITLETSQKKVHKKGLDELYNSVITKYDKLTEAEIKILVVEDKWFTSLQSYIEYETQRITQRFTEHVNELYDRYAQTLPELERQVEICTTKVKKHLKKITIIGHKEVTVESLLTGKTRLPGFSKEWETKRLGDIASFFKGSSLFKKTDMSLDGKLRCIHYGELFTIYGECITEVLHGTDRDEAFFCSVSNDVLMPASDVTPNGLATASCISESDIILGGDILVIRVPVEILNGVFLAYTIKINRNQVMQLVTGTTVYHLYGRDMANFEFDLPSIQEQNAIVSVLSDMDAEIAALEQRRNKTIAIKQGMMQQLLTDKVRFLKSNDTQ